MDEAPALIGPWLRRLRESGPADAPGRPPSDALRRLDATQVIDALWLAAHWPLSLGPAAPSPAPSANAEPAASPPAGATPAPPAGAKPPAASGAMVGVAILAQIGMMLAFQSERWQRNFERLLAGNGYVAAEFLSALTLAVVMLIPQIALLMPLYTTLVGGDLVAKESEDGTLRMMLAPS